ncbi:MAG: ABC transporter permease [Anaerolineae bacterium]|jgi:ABC-2 type transport system permease protein
MKAQLLRAWYICRKDLRAYYRKPPLISWGLMFPAAMVLAFYLRNPGDIGQMVPGLIGITLLFGATSMEVVAIAFEKRIGALERLAMAPVSVATILLGKVATGAIFALVLGAVVTLVALTFTGVPALSAGLLLSLSVTLILGSVVFSLLGAFVSVAVKEVFDAMTLANYFRFPMLFLSGTFAPLAATPDLLRWLAYLMPLTYVVDALRHALRLPAAVPLVLDWAVVLGFTVLLALGTGRTLVRQLEEP